MIYEVVVDLQANELDRVFDFYGENVAVGSRVLVEFGRKLTVGFVVKEKTESEFFDKLKPIKKVLGNEIIPEMLSLMDFLKKKYNLRYIDILRLFVPSLLRSQDNAEKICTVVKAENGKDLIEEAALLNARAQKQKELLLYLAEIGEAKSSVLNAKFGAAALSALVKKGILKLDSVVERRTPNYGEAVQAEKHTLNDEQNAAVSAIIKGKGTFLLHGVTGSGKTEVYMTVIDKVIEKNKTAIMLVPEISLTPQILRLFRSRFGDSVAILHSELSGGERFDEWKRLFSGEAKIAIGPRSAIFAPLKNLGAIIIDEEHDTSYISDSNPRYDTREVAAFRSKFNNCPLVLGSATPDIETYAKAKNGKYTLLELPERFAKFEKKDMEIIDMGGEFRNGNKTVLSYALLDAIKQTVEKGEQVILFLNRRGFSSFLMCKECGYIPKCEECDINLTYHRSVSRLKCHYCGKNYTVPNKCPKCQSEHIRFGRTGTEQVVMLLKEKFPDVKVARMDFDTTSTKGAHFRILEDFGKGNSQILVGTQMLAKGHDFPNVTLVGILDMDFSLFLDDFRASERTFQLATQVAGRAGRADKEGRVLLQTFVPNHYVFRLAKRYDYKEFFDKELNSRKVTKFPPFTTVLRVLFTSENDELAFSETKKAYLELKEYAKNRKDFVYINAMKSPVNRIKNKYRYQILARILKDDEDSVTQKFFSVAGSVSNQINCFVELNPQNLK